MARSVSDGVSAMDGRSQFVGNNPIFYDLNMMKQFRDFAIQIGLPKMISGMIDVTRHYMAEIRELKKYEIAFNTARELAEEKKTTEALDYVENALMQMEASGKFKDVMDEFQKVIHASYKEMLINNNEYSRDSLKSFCQEMIDNTDDLETKEAWKAVSKIVDAACEHAGEIEDKMLIERTDCENWKLAFYEENLRRIGIPAQAFYGAPESDDHAGGYLITPLLPEEAEERIRGIDMLAEFSRGMKNIESRELYDAVYKVAPAVKGAHGFTESKQLSGLTKAEGEMMREMLFSDYDNAGLPIAVVESPDGDGTWAVLYPSNIERRVNETYAQCLLYQNGYGKMTSLEKDLADRAKVRDMTQGMITVLAKDRGDSFIVADPSNAAGKRDDKAEMPDHFLRIDKGHIEECKAVYDENTGEWSVDTIKTINLSKLKRGQTRDDMIKESVMSLCKNPMIFSEKQAAQLGITKDEFAPNEKLMAHAQKIRSVRNLGTVQGDNLSKEERKEISRKVRAQRDFTAYAVREASRECGKKPTLDNIMDYIADNTEDLVDKYYANEVSRLAKREEKGRDITKAREALDAKYELLKNMDEAEYGLADWTKDARDEIGERIIQAVYEPDVFTASAIDSVAIDEKEIFDIQRKLARARAMAETPLAINSFSAAVRGIMKETIEERIINNKMLLRRQYPGITENALEARAVLADFTESIHNAAFYNSDIDLSPNEYTQKYGFDMELAMKKIQEKMMEQTGFWIDELIGPEKREDLISADPEKARAAIERIDPIIRKEVAEQMKNSATRRIPEQER